VLFAILPSRSQGRSDPVVFRAWAGPPALRALWPAGHEFMNIVGRAHVIHKAELVLELEYYLALDLAFGHTTSTSL